MSVLISGSYAFDTIMVFQDQFKNHILPEQVHILNVCFFVPQLRKEFGGCAGNIAYNLKLLGGEPLPMATVGKDFAPYRQWLAENQIPHHHIVEIDGTYTAQAFLTTDTDHNQIIAFHPGAMDYAHQNQVSQVSNVAADTIELGIVSPDGRDAMLQHAEQFAALGIPFFFDPGQGLPMFDAEQLHRFVDQATYIIVNDYEAELLQQKTCLSLAAIAARVEALVVTRGAHGVDLYQHGEQQHIAAIRVAATQDPTGCGDALRAGLLYGLTRQMDLPTAVQLGAVMGGIKVEHCGSQNHRPSQAAIATRYRDNFGSEVAVG